MLPSLVKSPEIATEVCVEKLYPLLLKSLEKGNCDVKRASLSALKYVVDLNNQLAVERVELLYKTLIGISKLADERLMDSEADIRIAALEIITKINAIVPTEKLMTMRKKLLDGLKSALDDPKRLVRKRAASAMQTIYLKQYL